MVSPTLLPVGPLIDRRPLTCMLLPRSLYLMDVDHSSALGRPLCLGEDE